MIERKLLCSKNEYTKSESNSQLVVYESNTNTDCVQRTNIQNLKAIHNCDQAGDGTTTDCVQRTNIQNLKAIHNAYPAIKKGLSGLSFTFTPIITVDYIQPQI